MYLTLFLPSANKYFWLRWTGYTLLGIAVSMALLIALVGRFINNWPPLAFGATVGCLFGLTTGFAQTRLLKLYLRLPWRWMIATIVGWVLFWSLNMAGVMGRGTSVDEKIVEGLVHGALFGALLGTLQGMVLPSKRDAALWATGSTAIWAFCAALGDGLKAATAANAPLELMVALPLSALLSGIAAHRMLRAAAFGF